jgi:hypothetical protein
LAVDIGINPGRSVQGAARQQAIVAETLIGWFEDAGRSDVAIDCSREGCCADGWADGDD